MKILLAFSATLLAAAAALAVAFRVLIGVLDEMDDW